MPQKFDICLKNTPKLLKVVILLSTCSRSRNSLESRIETGTHNGYGGELEWCDTVQVPISVSSH